VLIADSHLERVGSKLLGGFALGLCHAI